MKFLYIQEMALEMTANASRFLAPEDTTIIMKIKYKKTKRKLRYDYWGSMKSNIHCSQDTTSLSTYV
jgi:hypothetical protein